MGNIQHHCPGINNDLLELDRPGAIYLPNDTISGSVLYTKKTNASILLTGIIYFKKRKKKTLEKCQIKFFSTEFNLNSSLKVKQNFKLHLDDHLPPSFNDINTYPNITYSINLIIYKKSKDEILSSIPISVCPHVYLDRPLLLTPLFFGPIENHISGIKLEVKINRAIFTFNDTIQIFYEIQNPNQQHIYNIQISLGIYYVIESNVWQEDVCNGAENSNNITSNNKLIRNKALLNIPNKIYLPPTFKFQYRPENDPSSFNLEIDYKIHFKVYLENMENLWQVDVPIIICNDTIEQTENIEEENNDEAENVEEEINNKTENVEEEIDNKIENVEEEINNKTKNVEEENNNKIEIFEEESNNKTENIEENNNKIENIEEENNNKTEIISQSFNVNTNIYENKEI
ncbi:unnamed protein product [Rotaria sordida]|uniref:Arrestin C-terminal-like domain-containing protein n=1 Tax=Rotaria sordida TaxID=392033 RepID=A0A819MTA1_9BILA|nr:unnamed protein product [Rotaria sordida]